MKCKTCGRVLDNVFDPLSENCGGDCAHCQLRYEVDAGDYDTAVLIALDIALAAHKIKVGAQPHG